MLPQLQGKKMFGWQNIMPKFMFGLMYQRQKLQVRETFLRQRFCSYRSK